MTSTSTSLTATLSECIATYQTRSDVTVRLLIEYKLESADEARKLMRKAGVQFPKRLHGVVE